MKLTQLTAALLAASQASTASLPTPPLPPWYPLQGWQINTLTTTNPSTTPYSLNTTNLTLTITNPSLIPAVPAPHASGGGYVAFLPTTARCELHWKTDAQTPYGYSTNSCVADAGSDFSYSQATWTVTLNELHTELPGQEYYMLLLFELRLNATVYGTLGYKRMTGGATFRAGEELEGACEDGEGGVCEFGLKDGMGPVLIQPTLQECRSACG